MIRLLLLLLALLTAPSGAVLPLDRANTVAMPDASSRDAAPLPEAVVGTASWFASPAHVSAAGPALRAALGNWRGQVVTVCGNGRCAATVLGDWMAADRLIDLDRPIFEALAPLSVGVITVRIYPGAMPVPPATDMIGGTP